MVRPRDRDVVDRGECVELHVALDLAPFAVQCVELLRQCQPTLEAVGGQALDADRHVGQPSGRVDAWADGKAEICRARRPRVAAGHLEQCRDPRMQAGRCGCAAAPGATSTRLL